MRRAGLTLAVDPGAASVVGRALVGAWGRWAPVRTSHRFYLPRVPRASGDGGGVGAAIGISIVMNAAVVGSTPARRIVSRFHFFLPAPPTPLKFVRGKTQISRLTASFLSPRLLRAPRPLEPAAGQDGGGVPGNSKQRGIFRNSRALRPARPGGGQPSHVGSRRGGAPHNVARIPQICTERRGSRRHRGLKARHSKARPSRVHQAAISAFRAKSGAHSTPWGHSTRHRERLSQVPSSHSLRQTGGRMGTTLPPPEHRTKAPTKRMAWPWCASTGPRTHAEDLRSFPRVSRDWCSSTCLSPGRNWSGARNDLSRRGAHFGSGCLPLPGAALEPAPGLPGPGAFLSRQGRRARAKHDKSASRL